MLSITQPPEWKKKEKEKDGMVIGRHFLMAESRHLARILWCYDSKKCQGNFFLLKWEFILRIQISGIDGIIQEGNTTKKNEINKNINYIHLSGYEIYSLSTSDSNSNKKIKKQTYPVASSVVKLNGEIYWITPLPPRVLVYQSYNWC